MTRVVVTGGSGFIGINLLDSLQESDHEVVNLDIAPTPNSAHSALWRQTDLLDRERLIRMMADIRPTVVIHLAARTDLDGIDAEAYAANTEGTRNLVDAANAAGTVERVVVASTRLVFDTPYQPTGQFDYRATTEYGRSKIEVERLVLAQTAGRVPCIIVRPTSIWGPWFGVPYRNFFMAIGRGAYLHPRGRRMLKTMGYVGNVAFQIRRLAEAPLEDVAGRVFYVADYQPLEVHDWASRVAHEMGAPPIREVPLPLLWLLATGGTAAAMVRLPAPITRFRLTNLLADVVFEMGATLNIAGDCPFTMANGIANTVDWLRGTGALKHRR